MAAATPAAKAAQPAFRVDTLPPRRTAGRRSRSALGEADAPADVATYEDRYVAFIDILGFTEIVNRSGRSGAGPDSLGSIFSALDVDFSAFEADYNRHQTEASDHRPDLRVHTFSDFVVASCHASEAGLDLLVFLVWSLCTDWLSKEFLCRGGIARGKVIHRPAQGSKPALVFGPAFNDAYLHEHTVADYPRVVLAREVRTDFQRYRRSNGSAIAEVKKLVAPCDDGPHWIDLFAHLRKGGFSFLAPGPGPHYRAEAEQFRHAIRSRLEDGADTPKWHRKTLWLAQQFNQAVFDSAYADMKVTLY